MARTLLLCALLGLYAVSAATAFRKKDSEVSNLLRESLAQHHGRHLNQYQRAESNARGANFASASATAGGGMASTSQTASGPGATVSGVSQVGQKVDSCARGPANSAACQTLTTADRSTGCTDIAPDINFTCAEQAGFGKCDSDFIYLGAFCLKSCNRCGGQCVDTAPSGGACTLDACNSTTITAGPYCLKTCGRCSAAMA